MPIPLTNPGVYIQELTNPVHPIVGVPTSVAAFVGFAPQGVVDDPFQVNSWADYENEFGELSRDYWLSYAVYLFFLNGGSTALVVRTSDDSHPEPTATAKLSHDITLDASSPGEWGADLSYTVDTDDLLDKTVNQFNLKIRRKGGSQESYPGANLIPGTPQYLPTLLSGSKLVTGAKGNLWKTQPANTPVKKDNAHEPVWEPFTVHKEDKGAAPPADDAGAAKKPAKPPPPPSPLGFPDKKSGVYALTKADIFNVLCLPVDPGNTYEVSTILEPALAFCVARRAMLIVDPPTSWSEAPPPLNFQTINPDPLPRTGRPIPISPNAAVYYPNLTLTDNTGANFNVGPCGAVAGVWASTDSSRGVWKAPAGTAASITGITDFAVHVDDGESGVLNPLAVNALRTMPAVGPVAWGTRTTVGADQAQNQWKYLPVRRLALYIEESLRRGTQWAVFEPNDEPLWASLRLNVTAFMQGLFRQGAFQGTKPSDAYLVQCDANNNPQDQIDLGIVNILVGFKPLYPAEFVIINIQQQSGLT